MPNGIVDFRTIKGRVSMLHVLDHYGLIQHLHRSGNTLSGPCPIHNGHNKTQFRVSLNKNCWNCFGDCNGGGSVIDFVARMEHVDLNEAACRIGQWFDVETMSKNRIQSVRSTKEPKRFNPPLRFRLSLDQEHAYLRHRGLNAETIQTFGVGQCTHGMMAGRIAIPIHNVGGLLVAYVGRWPGFTPADVPKYKLPKGFMKSLEVFNLHRVRNRKHTHPLIVVEGFFDCMKLSQLGYRNVVAIMGSTLSESQAKHLIDTEQSTHGIALMFDEDPAGQAGRNKAAQRLERDVAVRLIEFPRAGLQPEDLTAAELAGLLA